MIHKTFILREIFTSSKRACHRTRDHHTSTHKYSAGKEKFPMENGSLYSFLLVSMVLSIVWLEKPINTIELLNS